MTKPDVQQSIREYHVSMYKAIRDDDFVTDLDGITSFINDNEEVDEKLDDDKLDLFEEKNLGLPDPPEIDEVVDNTDRRKQADTYDQFIGAEVALPDTTGKAAMARVMKRVKDNDENAIGVQPNNMLTNTSLYEVVFPDGHVEEL